MALKEKKKKIKNPAVIFSALFLVFICPRLALTTSLTSVSDLISTSRPGGGANHTIKFTAATLIPPAGKIIIAPQSGKFNLPSNFNYTDLDLAVGGENKPLAPAAGSGSGSAYGATAETGAAGRLIFTLNNADSIPAGSAIVVKAGKNAVFEYPGATQIINPADPGSYAIDIKTYDASGVLLDRAQAMIAIVKSVSVSSKKAAAPPPLPPVPVAPPPAPAGGGGGGPAYLLPETRVTFRGRAYPGSRVFLLRDGARIAAVLSDNNANFEISAAGFGPGAYNFGVFTQDKDGRQSVTQTFPVFLTSGVGVVIGGIFLSPTIAADKEEVKRGEILNIFGTSAPEAEISIFIGSGAEIIKKTESDKQGAYLCRLDTSEIEFGDHSARTRARKGNEFSNWSATAGFTVARKTAGIKRGVIVSCGKFDLNCDGRINLIDFSILVYWWKRPLTAAAKAKVDLNGDGKVNLTDFSILAYHWTG